MAVLRLIVRTMKKRIVMKKKSGMRKMVVVMLLILASAAVFAKSGENAVRQEKLLELISEYSEKKNFNVIRISSFSASAIKGVVREASAFDGDKDLKDTLEVIKGIRGGVIVKYGDCSEAVRRGFDRRLGELLENCDVLFEAKDGEDMIRMYGVIDENAEDVKDFILYIPSDAALVCLFGSIKLDALAKIVAE